MDDQTTGDAGYSDASEQQGSSITNGSNGNPAWNEFLEAVPQEFHNKVTPVLEKWDKGVQERFQKVHSEYEPWKPILKTGVDPETTQFALNLLNTLNDNPELVHKAIGDYYKLGDKAPVEQGQVEPVDQDDPYKAKFEQLEQQANTMAQILLKQREEQVNAQADAELDQELAKLRKTYGEFDEEYILAKMTNGHSAEDAVKSYYQAVERMAKSKMPRPLIMGGGGGVPGQNVDPRKLSDSGTKNLVVEMLKAAADQNR